MVNLNLDQYVANNIEKKIGIAAKSGHILSRNGKL